MYTSVTRNAYQFIILCMCTGSGVFFVRFFYGDLIYFKRKYTLKRVTSAASSLPCMHHCIQFGIKTLPVFVINLFNLLDNY